MEDFQSDSNRPIHRHRSSIPIRHPIQTLKGDKRERDRQTTDRDINIDVRYLDNIKSFTDRIRSSYSCNQQQCPMIRERLNRHQHDHHLYDPHTPTSRTWSHDSTHQQNHRDQAITTSPTTSQHRIGNDSESNETNLSSIAHRLRSSYKRLSEYRTNQFNQSSPAQTIKPDLFTQQGSYDTQFTERSNVLDDSSQKDNEPTNTNDYIKRDSCEPNKSNHLINDPSMNDDIRLKLKQTKKTLSPKLTTYNEDLQNEVNEWLQDVPMYHNSNLSDKMQRQSVINNLIEKLNNMYIEADGIDCTHKLKLEIDDFLNRLPMWYPGAKRDQDQFKDDLKKSLLTKIMSVNEKNGKFIYYNNQQNNTNTDNAFKSVGVQKESSNRYFSEESKELVENEINEWLRKIKLQEHDEIGRSVNKKDVIIEIMHRLAPLLNEPINLRNHKLIIKSEIVEILHNLPISLNWPGHKKVYINRLAEELVNKLLSIQATHENCKPIRHNHFNSYRTSFHANEVIGLPIPHNDLRHILKEEVSECLIHTKIDARSAIKDQITDILIDYLDIVSSENDQIVTAEVYNILLSSGDITEAQASDMAKFIVENARYVCNDKASTTKDLTRNLLTPCISDTISVYTSEEIVGPSNYPGTSTPKKPVAKKAIPKLNFEEIAYMENLAKLIRAWMETLPEKFDAPEDNDYKETVIKDLAGDIMDEAKLEQLAPGTRKDKEKYIKYIIQRWLYRLDVFDLEKLDSQIQELCKRLEDIPVPTMTRPQHGGRQAMDNIKHMEGELGWKEYFVPKALDVLEDEISIWMNEQPVSIYMYNDKNERNRMIHELAKIIQDHLTKKRSEAEISEDVKQWLNKIVKPEVKHYIVDLTHMLKERVVNLPQDATLAANLEKKLQQRAECLEAKTNPYSQQYSTNKIVTNQASNGTDPDKTMKEFIAKFIQHNYDIDDSMARGAFSHLLETELQRLTPITRKEVYDKFSKSEPHDKFSPERLEKELQYIKDISDWLKNIPIDASFNTVGTRQRVDFVNDLARNINEVEEQRIREPGAIDYNMYLASIIRQFTELLPIFPEHKCNIIYMIDQLIGKVIVHRKPVPYRQANKVNISINSTGIQEQNLSDFIDEYIRVHGREIAHDELKLEAWSARLMKEIRKLVRDTAESSKLCKAQVYSKFANIPVPGDESVRRFSLELEYVKEISKWMKNLPLLPISSQQAQETRIEMISELAERMSERESRKVADSNDIQADTEFSDYVSKWISEIPLDTTREIVLPVVIQQLINRMEKVNKKPESISQLLETCNRTQESSKSKSNYSRFTSKKSSRSVPVTERSQRPECLVIDAIEKWCNSLPVQGDNPEETKTAKDNAARQLFQKICELNDDPSVFNDDLLYQDMLAEEVDSQLDKLQQNTELQNKRENLKTKLLQTISDAKNIIKQKSAGENYKQKLENAVEMSFPNPIHTKQQYNPGFEIYKNRLATMFILENFDHGIDAVKMKYEKKIREEIDKYFQDAQNINAIPLSKDQIYNELYSALFKVPVPNEHSVIEEVEEVKTRCEIDGWFEDLPLKEADGVGELLEWDQILSTLAKRIHEIEKNETKPDENIHNEITKWLVKLPLLPGSESNIDTFADKLQGILKNTAEARKCNISRNVKGKKGKVKSKTSKQALKTGKVPGPSNTSKTTVSKQQPYCQGSSIPQKKSADIILEIVEEWCNLLPLYANTPQEDVNLQLLKEDLITKLVIKISELNSDPDIFDDDLLYDELFDEELEKIITALPACCESIQSKGARKMQIKDAITSIKPLIREERSRYEYKQELKNTVGTVLVEPHNITAEKEELFNNLKNEIVENFVLYNYNRDDYEGRQVYKMKVHDAVVKYVTDIADKKNTDAPLDPLMRRNHLLCELAKIPIPSDVAVKDEVEEIRMKNEVTEFFDELSLPKADVGTVKFRNQVKISLAKRLNDLEKTGHNCANERKMKTEINRYLKKLNKEVKPEIVDTFMEKLKNNEIVRKTPPSRNLDYYEASQNVTAQSLSLTGVSGNQYPSSNRQYVRPTPSPGFKLSQSAGQRQYSNKGPVNANVPGFTSNHSSAGSGEKWLSLQLGSPPKREPGFHSPHVIREYRPSLGEIWSASSFGGDKSLGQSLVHSQGFVDGIALHSSNNEARGTATKFINEEEARRKSILRRPCSIRGYSNVGSELQQINGYPTPSPRVPSSAQVPHLASATSQAISNCARQISPRKHGKSTILNDDQVGPKIVSQETNFNTGNEDARNIGQVTPGNISTQALPSSTNNTNQSVSRRPMSATIHESIQRSGPQVISDASDEEDRICDCKRRRDFTRRRDFCGFPRNYCDGYSPFLCRMPFPGFFFY